MCIAIPMKLTEIDGQEGTVEEGGVRHRISLALLEQPRVGHYVLVHAGFAITLLDPEEARGTLELMQQAGIVEGDPD